MLKKEQINALRKKVFNKRIIVFLVLVLVIEAVVMASKKGLINASPFVINVLDFILVASISLLVANIIIRFTVERVFVVFDHETEVEQRIFLSKIYSFFIYTVALAVILSHIGVSAENITIFLGLVTTGLALAVKDFLVSILSWMILLYKKPFRLGDVIKVENDLGEISQIGVFFVTLQNEDGKIIKVPNKIFLEKIVQNFGKGKMVKELRFPLEKTIPIGKMKNIEDQLRGNYPVEQLQVSSDITNNHLQMVISYQCQAWELRRITTAFIDIINRDYKDYLKENN